MSRKYKFKNPFGVYFVSFATVGWVDVFVRECYFEILMQSIHYCRKSKGMMLFAYCFMPSHIHLIFHDSNGDPMGLLRSFKKFTSNQLIEVIKSSQRESRKQWLLQTFREAAQSKSNVVEFQFWQHHNKPIELWSSNVIKQKIDYIHNNPVLSGFVTEPVAWKYSSARNFAGDQTVFELDTIGFLG